ncbi:MAG TPA: DnaB-like helicase N-terminal domain-containing protein, partial [Ktedonobacteraceae bacterium]|nr:DnaB-like helicase N-terminal domain-containing protein [Ktedonobacteraceae bacterium]
MEKQLPHNMEAESGVLGSILIDPQAIALVVDFLQPEDFYRNAHRIIFSAMLSLFEHHAPPDLITVCDVLERQGKLAEVGGPAYITSLVNHVPTSMHVEHYGHIVSKSALHRRLIQAASSIAALGFEEAEHALDTAEELIYGLGNRSIASEVSSAGTVFTEFFNQLEQLPLGGSVVGVPSGFHELDRMTRGFQRSDLIIMAARPAMGKCLSASMLIDNPMTGERLTIEEAVQRRLPFVYGIAPDEKIRPTAVSHWIDSGIKPCYRVQTRSGRTVEVTGHHPFLTVQGWVPLSELEVGRHIAVPGRLECFGGDDSMPLEKVRLLAYFMAGGGLTGGSPEFASTDPLIAEDFKQIIAHSFPELTIRQIQTTYTAVHLRKGVRNPLCQWLEELGLKGQYADQRFFPACVWRWGKRYLVEFLRVLVSCDGCIHLDTGTPVIEFTVTSQQLAADVQHAFLRVGIVSQFSSKTILYWGKRQAVWSVVISHPESVKRYQEEIGWIGEKSVRSAEYAKVLDYVDLQRTSGSDVYWDEIVSIEAIGDQPVYDLTVPDGANFIAQDIFVHNTSMCLSIAANAAIPFGRGVLLFSCEMSKVQIIQRLTGMLSGVNVQRLFTRQINEDEMEQVIAVGHTVDAASLWI